MIDLMQYKIQKTENVYNGFFKLNKYHLANQLFQGGWSDIYTREIFERGHAAAVLLFDRNRDKLVFVEQFRPGAISTEESPWLIELVAGMIEKNERPENVVKRETIEEAGGSILGLQKICEYLVSPGGSTERIWLYLGEIDSIKVAKYAGLDFEQEDIKIHVVSSQTAFNWLDSGRLSNAMTIIAVQWLKLHMAEKEAFWQK